MIQYQPEMEYRLDLQYQEQQRRKAQTEALIRNLKSKRQPVWFKAFKAFSLVITVLLH